MKKWKKLAAGLTALALVVSSLFLSQPRQVSAAEVTADCGSVSDVRRFDKSIIANVARGGYFINQNPNYLPHYYDTLQEMGVEVFRVDWILSDLFFGVVSKDDSGEIQYNWDKLDTVVIPMLEHGIKPMFCMNYVAGALGGYGDNPQPGDEYKGGMYPPSDMEEYAEVIRAYVQHYKDLGYTGLYWESHNEPEGFTYITSDKAYEMYKYFSEAVESVDPSANIGGFGAVGMAWINYLRDFVNRWANDPDGRPRMDYFSFHQYARDDFDYYTQGVKQAFIDAGVKEEDIPPFHITEWNSGGDRNGDTNENASNTAKMMYAAVMNPSIERIYMWNAVDAGNGADLFTGEKSPVTIDSHRKASGNVFLMYKNLEPNIVNTDFDVEDKKKNGIITKSDDGNRVSMIFWNDTDSETSFDINLSKLGMSDDNMKITKYVIDENHGNYYKDYEEGRIGYDVGPTENMGIAESCITVGTDTFERTETLPEYSVVQIILEKTSDPVNEGPIEKNETSDRVNVALYKPVTVSSNSETTEDGWAPSKLTNGIPVSYGAPVYMGWKSELHDSADAEEWIEIDLGYDQQLNEVVLTPVDYGEYAQKGFPQSFVIEGKGDGSEEWTTLYSGSPSFEADGKVALADQSFELTEKSPARYLRIRATELSRMDDGSYGLCLMQIKAYADEVSMQAPDGVVENLQAKVNPDKDTSIDLTWENTATNADRFVLERYNEQKPEEGWVNVKPLLQGNTYTDTGLKGGNSYKYRIAVCNPYGKSEYSDETEPIKIFLPEIESTFEGEGLYTITSVNNQKALTAVNSGTEDAPSYSISMQDYTGGKNQQWKVSEVDNGVYSIVNALSGTVLQSWGTTVGYSGSYNGYESQKYVIQNAMDGYNYYSIQTSDAGTKYYLNAGNSKFEFVSNPVFDELEPLWSFSKLAESIEITTPDGNCAVPFWGKLQLTANVYPENANNKRVDWELVSTTNEASFQGITDTGLLSAGEVGKMTIRATSQDAGKASDEITIYVLGSATEFVPTEVTISPKEDTITALDGKMQLTANVTGYIPEYDENTAVTWSVTDVNGQPTTLAEISEDGLLTAKRNGTVKVTAEAQCDGTKAEKEIKINMPTDSFSGEGTYILRNKGTGMVVQYDTGAFQNCRAGEFNPDDSGQQFEFIESTINPGSYRIKAKDADAYFTDWNDRMVIIPGEEGDNSWKVTDLGSGYYQLNSNGGGRSLADTTPGDNIMLNNNAGDKAQWEFVEIGRASLEKVIEEAKSLNEQDYSAASYAKLRSAIEEAEKLIEEGASESQLLAAKRGIQAAINGLEVPLPEFAGEGTYLLRNKETGKVLAFSDGAFTMQNSSGAQQQRFVFTHYPDHATGHGEYDTYKIQTPEEGIYLTDWGNSLGTGTDDWDSYYWLITPDEEGYYSIRSVNAESTNPLAAKDDGTVELNSSAGDYAKWILMPYTAGDNDLDLTNVENALRDAKSREESDYAKNGWAALQEKVSEVEAFLTQMGITQEQVDEKTGELNEMIAGLVPLLDTNGGFDGDGEYIFQNLATGNVIAYEQTENTANSMPQRYESEKAEQVFTVTENKDGDYPGTYSISNNGNEFMDWSDRLAISTGGGYGNNCWDITEKQGFYTFSSRNGGQLIADTGNANGGLNIRLDSNAGDAALWLIIQKPKADIPIEEIRLNVNELELKEGESAALTAQVLPENTTEDKTVVWSSSDEKIVTVDEEGMVAALKEGEAVITAKAGQMEARCAVTVKKAEPAVTVPDAPELIRAEAVDNKVTVEWKAPENNGGTAITNYRIFYSLEDGSEQKELVVNGDILKAEITDLEPGQTYVFAVSALNICGESDCSESMRVTIPKEEPEQPQEPEDPQQPQEPENPENPQQPQNPDQNEGGQDAGNKDNGDKTESVYVVQTGDETSFGPIIILTVMSGAAIAVITAGRKRERKQK